MEDIVITAGDEEIRQRIMVAAREQFLAFGFSKVTVDEIANKLGMSKKTLYRFFPSKEELLSAVVSAEIAASESKCQVIMQQTGDDFIERLRQIMTLIAMQYSKVRPPLLEDLKKFAPHVWQMIAEHRAKMIKRDFAQLLRDGVSAGVFRTDVNMDIVLSMYSICSQHMINPDALSEQPYSAQQVFESIITVLFNGLFTEEGRRNFKLQLHL